MRNLALVPAFLFSRHCLLLPVAGGQIAPTRQSSINGCYDYWRGEGGGGGSSGGSREAKWNMSTFCERLCVRGDNGAIRNSRRRR